MLSAAFLKYFGSNSLHYFLMDGIKQNVDSQHLINKAKEGVDGICNSKRPLTC